MHRTFVGATIFATGVLLAFAARGAAQASDVAPRSSRTGFVEPARYPLELVLPRSADSSPVTDEEAPAVPAGHRIFRAYPGLEYDIRAVVLGGAYPFRFSLADAPPGMTIDAATGRIHWPRAAGTVVRPAITVTDAEGTTRTASWSITVTASGFRFVDAARGDDAHAGTRERPWRTLGKVKSSGAAGETVYFREGAYRTADLEPTGGDEGGWRRAEFNGRVHPVQWLAYPEERPVIDNGYESAERPGWFLRLQGSASHPVYLDGLEFTKARHIGLQFVSGTGDYAVFRRLNVHHIAEVIRGGNSAGIMTLTSQGRPSWYTAFQDVDFHDNACGGIKQYSQRKLLWEDCQFRDSGLGPDLKSDVARFEVRRCSFVGNRGETAGLFGNLHPARGGEITGEIRFNRVICGSPEQWALDLNQDGLANEIHLYRNTFVGGVRVRNTDAEDGPFHFTRNVVINRDRSPERVRFESVSAPDRVRFVENLAGSSDEKIVDATGRLQGPHRAQVGRRGAELAGSAD